MEFREILRHRKMVRAYDRRPIPNDVLDRVLSVVVHAPSAGYTQGNRFLVLDDPDAVEAFFRLTDDPDDPLDDADRGAMPPVVALPLSHERAYLDRYSEPDKAPYGLGDEARWPVPYWDIDAGMAAMLLLLAAIDEGLGAWFSGIAWGEAEVLARFGVPDGFHPIGFVGLGYPAAADPMSSTQASPSKRARVAASELLHRNGW